MNKLSLMSNDDSVEKQKLKIIQRYYPEKYITISNLPNEYVHYLSDIHNFIVFVLHKFITKQRIEKMLIDIEFEDDLHSKTGFLGNCIWEDKHYRPNEFTIQIDSNLNIKNMFNTLAHEMTHVIQWAKGDFYEVVSKSNGQDKVYKYKGKEYKSNKMSYLDKPWEVEAFGRSFTLILQWCDKYELEYFSFIPEELLSHDQLQEYITR